MPFVAFVLCAFALPVTLVDGDPSDDDPSGGAPSAAARTALVAEIFAAEQPARRARAAALLEPVLAREAELAELLDAASLARRTLLDGRMARRIERAALAARWTALADAGAASARLADDLRAVAADLRFEPSLEADLPEGFPRPTPIGEVALKRYPRYRMATAEMGGGRRGTGAFWTLFQHINANEIPMTAPVETTFDARSDELVPMTMAFLYEGPDQGRAGSDGNVQVVDVDAAWVVSLGLRGNDTRARIAAARALLHEWIAARPELEVAGDLRTFGYNSPMVRGSRRTFEVQIPVRLRDVRDV